MDIKSTIFVAILCLCISCVYTDDTIKYASSCSVNLCTLKTVINNDDTDNGTGNSTNATGCADLPLCYSFDTSLNTSICAPQVVCSLFDPCTSAKKCATNTSVCIVNTCCSNPICMPIALTSSCSKYVPSSRSFWSGSICPNATWERNGTLVISNYLIDTNTWFNFGDFFIDSSNNFYINDPSNYRVLKFSSKNTSNYTVVAVTNNSVTYQAESIFVDKSGVLYTAESGWTSSYMIQNFQIVKYTMRNGVTTRSVIYGPKTCDANTSSLCGSGGLFVDKTGVIYYSDRNNHRVLKITATGTSATVVAGTSGMFGSLANQLYYPGDIFVDSTGNLFVADQSNYRVMKFTPGNNIGTVLYSLPSFTSPTSVIVDNAGSVYFAANGNIYKYIPSLGATIQILPQMSFSYGTNKVRMDSMGNLYLSGYSMSNGVYRHNITSNYC